MVTGKIYFKGIMKKLSLITLIIAAGFIIPYGKTAEASSNSSFFSLPSDQEGDTINTGRVLKVNPFWLDIIPPSTGVQFYRDGIVFLSNTKSESRMLESHTSFGKVEAYYASLEDSIAGTHVLFSSSLSLEIPCEAMTFNKDYSVMYYTKLPTGRESEKIYQAKYQSFKNGKMDWISDNKPLSFCSDKSVYSHPALSADGEKMIFVSNRKESIGGMDLFISYKEGEDWSEPINLGNLINTQGNEISPFLDQSNNLFFSSDGIKGFGGYDIYMCRYNGRGWDKPLNLTRMINSPDDELAFTLSPLTGKTAFYSSRALKGNKQVKLFRVTFRDQYAVNRLTNLSNALRYIAQSGFTPSEEVIPVAEKTVPPPVQEKETPKEEISQVQKPEVKPAVETATGVGNLQARAGQSAAVSVEETPASDVDAVVYRVQFMSLSKPRGSYNITVGGKQYKTFEYFFNGVYRSCAGEFSSPATALNLQNQMKREGYPDAFIVAFKNNERITGALPATSKIQEQAAQTKEITRPQAAAEMPKEEPVSQDNAVIYRVQYATSGNPSGINQVTIDGVTYRTFEYLYSGAYRLCAGEFSTRAAAQELQSVMRRGQYKDAFIVVFKNGIRVTDPSFLK
jgi:hypothetical protein